MSPARSLSWMIWSRSTKSLAAGTVERLVIFGSKVGLNPRLAKKGVCFVDVFLRLLNVNSADGR